jgi:hypothetical protein
MESAVRVPLSQAACRAVKAWRYSQGSLPKTAPSVYLYENASEL